MTLEEKPAQTICIWQEKAATLLDEHRIFDLAKAKAAFKHAHGLGQVGRPSGMKRTVEPAEFEVLVGTSSRECDLQKVALLVHK